MRLNSCFVAVGVIALLTGCATPVALRPIGPNPNENVGAAGVGELQVFSRMTTVSDDENLAESGIPPWRQHTAYNIYAQNGGLVEHIGNSAGHYEEKPSVVSLTPGQYLIKAQASDYLMVTVPVTIEAGRVTSVHLDGDWAVPRGAHFKQVVTAPDGTPIGWRAKSG